MSIFLFCYTACLIPSNAPRTQEKINEESAETEQDIEGFELGDLIVNPDSLNFGRLDLDLTQTKELLFINTGSSTLSVVSASIVGDSAFSLESSFLNFDIEPESEEVIKVHFTPTEDVSYEAKLVILLSTESDAGEIALTGLGGTAQESETSSPTSEPDSSQGDGDFMISNIAPKFGSTSGGTQVTISGGPFDASATVYFGGDPAQMLSNDGSTIRVSTPFGSTEGATDVIIETSDGSQTASSAFQYFTDGSGQTGAIGSVYYLAFTGDYWHSTNDTSGANLTFISPYHFNGGNLVQAVSKRAQAPPINIQIHLTYMTLDSPVSH